MDPIPGIGATVIANHRRRPTRLREWFMLSGFVAVLLAGTTWQNAWKPFVLDRIAPLATRLSGFASDSVRIGAASMTASSGNNLQEENRQLHQRLAQLRLLEAENQRLRTLLNLPIPPTMRKVGARVLMRSPDHWFGSLHIDAGFEAGLSVNQVVLNDRGVLGKIVEVSANTARVQLISSPDSAVSCITEKERKPAILLGYVQGERGHLKYMQSYTHVQRGEKVFTSGLGGVYPKDLLLGTIDVVEQRPSHPVPEATVRLTAFDQLVDEVAVLVPDL